MNLAPLFRNFQKNKMELKRLVVDEEGDKNKGKKFCLKLEEGKDPDTSENMTLLVLKYKKSS